MKIYIVKSSIYYCNPDECDSSDVRDKIEIVSEDFNKAWDRLMQVKQTAKIEYDEYGNESYIIEDYGLCKYGEHNLRDELCSLWWQVWENGIKIENKDILWTLRKTA